MAQEIDNSQYQNISFASAGQWRQITTIEYYKSDVVFIETRKNEVRIGVENLYYDFIELSFLNESGGIVGSTDLPILETGQFVTVYYKILPEKWENGVNKFIIDHIVIPAESFVFNPTHKTNNNLNVNYDIYGRTLFTLNQDVEVMVLTEKIEHNLVPILTANGYGGWADHRGNLVPIGHSITNNINTNSIQENHTNPENNIVIENNNYIENEPLKEHKTSIFQFSHWITNLIGVVFILSCVIIIKKRRNK